MIFEKGDKVRYIENDFDGPSPLCDWLVGKIGTIIINHVSLKPGTMVVKYKESFGKDHLFDIHKDALSLIPKYIQAWEKKLSYEIGDME